MIKYILLPIFTLLSFGYLTAQDSLRVDTLHTLQEVVVTYQADKQTPITFQNIYKKDIKAKSTGQEPSFLLSETPSISNYSDAGNSQGYSYFRLRGIDQTRINMTLDGVPLNEPEDQGAYFSNYPDILNSVSKIQIQRGVGTSKNGVASYGGSVQLFSPNLADSTKTTFGLGYGSFNSLRVFGEYNSGIKNKKALLIFPEGSHCKDRFIRPLSKGFTRIIFRTINNNPSIKIHIIPIGITYQNASKYPSKVAINFGTPIIANQFYNANDTNTSIKKLKELVSHQLKELSVHIENNDTYQPTLQKLNKAQVDFTNVASVNSIIKSEEYPKEKMRSKNYASLLYYFVIINSFIPYSIWKFLSKKVTELEFVDTFCFGVNVVVFPLFYSLQSWIIYFFFGWKTAVLYFISSLVLVLLYSKLSTTPPLK